MRKRPNSGRPNKEKKDDYAEKKESIKSDAESGFLDSEVFG